MNKSILEVYESQKELFELLKPRLKTLIEILSKENNIEVHDVKVRVKEKDSLKKKIEKKQEKYKNINDITDVVGIRVITYFNDDLDKMAKVIEKEFKIDEQNSVDKRVMDPDRFGYSSLHYVVEFNDEKLRSPEYKNFKGIKFEIQIRSILQHAWAEIEHDIGYKSKKEIPREIRRDFSRIAGLLEIADNEFLRIKEFLKNYEQEVEKKIENKSLEILIDKITLTEYIEKSSIIESINQEISTKTGLTKIIRDGTEAKANLDSLEFFGISTIAQLDELLKEKKEKIINFYLKWNKDIVEKNLITALPYDISLFYLYYLLIFENYSLKKLKNYVSLSPIGNENIDSIIEDFQELFNAKFTP
ncbi:hypothetical protein [Domibacillus sp.]|uniref:GTP pyrophosphokinase n=1 Tax=Domibacillus sp. TaxID=1969783 RepID=UPI002810C8F6|nr:hypothetical protein [Domibacillus sp.]